MTQQSFAHVKNTLAYTVATIALAWPAVHGQQPQFRSSVDVTSVDVMVLDGRGQPITDLKPS